MFGNEGVALRKCVREGLAVRGCVRGGWLGGCVFEEACLEEVCSGRGSVFGEACLEVVCSGRNRLHECN